MKMYVLAVCLVLGGLMCLFKPENTESLMSGIFALIIGIVIIVFKSVKKRQEAEAAEQREAELREQQRQAMIARQRYEEAERERLAKTRAWDAVHAKWRVIVEQHNQLMNEIDVAYTIANNLNMPDSPQMQHVIELCKKDIALAEMFQKSQDEIQQVRIANGWADANEPTKGITTFPTFKRLAIIYEKQKDYENAIAVCQRAIELGYPDDGTDGQMPGRIARLMRKAGNKKKKLSTFETIDSTFSDDSGSPDSSAG